MGRLLNAAPALALLALGIWMVLTGSPQAFFLLVDAEPGCYVATCDGEQVGFEVVAGWTDSTGLMYLDCTEIVDVHGAEWVGEPECRLERGGD